jgi:hypothetical protein
MADGHIRKFCGRDSVSVQASGEGIMTRKRHWVIRCARRCKGFVIRAGIVTLAVLAVLIIMANTGEVVSIGIATERLTEALGMAAADTFAD